MLSIKDLSKKLTVAIFICAAFVLLTPLSAVAAGQPQEPVGEIIVRYRSSVSPGEMIVLGWSHGTANLKTLGDIKIQEVEITDGSSVGEKLIELKKDPSVEYAEPNYRREVLVTTPNDPYYSGYQWNMPITRANYAWDITKGSNSTVIAIIDTGVSLTHPDLSSKIVAGYDFVDNDSSPMDEQGHGTHVAGIAAAISNNGVGVAGVDWNARIMPVRVLDENGSGWDSDIAEGIIWATDHGADVINMSLGGPTSYPYTLQSAVDYAYSHGVVVVAAVGNSPNGIPIYPAACDHVIGVAATNSSDQRASFSNYGTFVDIAAPGETIASTYWSGGANVYAQASGTSMAAPHVAGLAALLVAVMPGSGAGAIEQRIEQTATDLGTPGRDNYYGYGRIDVQQAVAIASPYSATYNTAAVPATLPAAATTPVVVNVTNTSQSAWTSTGSNAIKLGYHWVNASTGAVVVFEDWQRGLLGSDLAAGASRGITIDVKTPTSPGNYTLKFDMVQEWITWFSGQGVATGNVSITVPSPYSATYNTAAVPATLPAAATTPVVVNVTNTSQSAWTSTGSNAIKLGYHWVNASTGAVVVFEDWQRGLLGSDLAAGASRGITIDVKTPTSPGNYTLKFNMVQEWITWFSGQGVATGNVSITVPSPYSATYNTAAVPATLPAAATTPVVVNVTNTSQSAWTSTGSNAIKLGYHWVNASTGAVVVFEDWQRGLLGSDLAAGASRGITIDVKTPTSPGNYTLKFNMVQEWITWFSSAGVAVGSKTVSVATPYMATYNSTTTPARMNTSKTYRVTVNVTNTSQSAWTSTGSNAIKLGYHWVNASTGAVVVYEDWQRGLLGSDLAAGASRDITIDVKTPTSPGNYTLKFNMVQEWITWFSWQGVATKDVEVAIPLYGADYTITGTLPSVSAGQTFSVDASLINTGSLTWTTTGPNAVKLGYHWVNASTEQSVIYEDWQRGTLSTNPVLPDGTATTTLTVKAPITPGNYILEFDLVQEWVTWFSWQGVATADYGVKIEADDEG